MGNYVYLVYPAKYKHMGGNIIKIGQTRCVHSRIKAYGSGSVYIFTAYVDDATAWERNVKHHLCRLFRARLDIGVEYFEGDIPSVRKEVMEITMKSSVDTIKAPITQGAHLLKQAADPDIAVISWVKARSKEAIAGKATIEAYQDLQEHNAITQTTSAKLTHKYMVSALKRLFNIDVIDGHLYPSHTGTNSEINSGSLIDDSHGDDSDPSPLMHTVKTDQADQTDNEGDQIMDSYIDNYVNPTDEPGAFVTLDRVRRHFHQVNPYGAALAGAKAFGSRMQSKCGKCIPKVIVNAREYRNVFYGYTIFDNALHSKLHELFQDLTVVTSNKNDYVTIDHLFELATIPCDAGTFRKAFVSFFSNRPGVKYLSKTDLEDGQTGVYHVARGAKLKETVNAADEPASNPLAAFLETRIEVTGNKNDIICRDEVFSLYHNVQLTKRNFNRLYKSYFTKLQVDAKLQYIEKSDVRGKKNVSGIVRGVRMKVDVTDENAM